MSKKRILVIEDSQDISEVLRQLLESCGYSVSCAPNGKAALERLQESQTALPHLILLDLMMPVMNGFEFRKAQRMDQSLSTIPVVVMSAHRDAAYSKSELAVENFISKPADLDVLLSTVETSLS